MNHLFFLRMAVVTAALFVATTGSSGGSRARVITASEKNVTMNHYDLFDVFHDQRVRFAADHGVYDPAALVAAVKDSPMAHLLISVAIEESLGDPVAVGAAGEQGAWQVIASEWGLVPHDLRGQAAQAERIIRALLNYSKGNKVEALARYNGGPSPPGKSYRYAERILKRAEHLQLAVNYLPPKGKLL